MRGGPRSGHRTRLTKRGVGLNRFGGRYLDADSDHRRTNSPSRTDAQAGRRHATHLSSSSALTKLLWGVATAFVGVLVLVPLIRLQQRALEDGGASYDRMLSSPDLQRIVLTTVGLALGSVVIALIAGTLLAWTAFRLSPRWQWMSLLPLLGLTLPPLAQVTGWAFLLSPSIGYLNLVLRTLPPWQNLSSGPIDIYTVPMIVVITGVMLVPYVYMFAHTGMRAIDSALLEAATASGATSRRVFTKIVLPLVRPSLMYATMIVLLLGLGQFTAPLLLGQSSGVRVLTTEMYEVFNTYPRDTGVAAAYGSPLIIFGLGMLVLQRYTLRDPERFTVVSTRGHRHATTSPRLGAAIVGAYIVVAFVLPLGANIVVALSPFWTRNIPWGDLSFHHFREVSRDGSATLALRTTLQSTLTAVVIVVPLAYLAATLQCYASPGLRILRRAMDALVAAPLVLPGVIFGAGIVLAYTDGPLRLYGTLGGIILAYVTVTLPHCTRLIQSEFVGQGQSFVEMAKVCRATSLRIHRQVILPMTAKAITAAAAFVIAILSHEFSASVMVRRPGTEVLGTLLYRYWTTGTMSRVAVLAIATSAISFAMLAVASLIGSRWGRTSG